MGLEQPAGGRLGLQLGAAARLDHLEQLRVKPGLRVGRRLRWGVVQPLRCKLTFSYLRSWVRIVRNGCKL